MREVITFLRENPQVFVLLVICIVLGLGTFLAVVFGLLSSGPGTTNGEPSGALGPMQAALSWLPLASLDRDARVSGEDWAGDPR